ncbi:MAG TPA: nitrous oxide reductase family maturation protein NosD [Vicinamibacterales bacterium]|nr:nitrous oxide reductase family maturation protein NosD [Vicinamibacterales bacterium]
MNRARLIRILAAFGAAAFVWLAADLPLWTMTMRAPQYPKGLQLQAYGTGVEGDLKELNILNHYIGMRPLDPKPELETKLFPIAITTLIVLCLASPLHRWIRRLAVTMAVAMPLGILADLQYWLYTYGHSLDPKAPIRLPPFTPLVLGQSTMGNFESTSMISTGLLCLIGAAAVLIAGNRLARRLGPATSVRATHIAAIATVIALAGLSVSPTSRLLAVTGTEPGSMQVLQSLIDAEPRGSVVTVPAGTYNGPITVRGPLTLVGEGMPIVDGGGAGSVVTIEGDGVVLRGFAIRNSGRNVTEEAAGIKASGEGHRIEWNDVRDVYFGIHVSGGRGHVIEHNVVAPGVEHGARPGHGISVWNTSGTRVAYNTITEARDGVYLSFTKDVTVASNSVTGCRYGLHSMYSEEARLIDNRLRGNLLGSALMNSTRLELRGNRIEQHREGSAAYGILLKDIGDLIAEDNVIVANRVGLYAEGVPDRPSREAIVRRNVFAGNDVGIALQANAALTFTENRIAENLTDVRALGSRLSPTAKWSRGGVGNSWSQYRGYDRDGDGIGDLAHRVDASAGALAGGDDLIRAFLYTPAHLALEAGARMFPLFRRPPLLVDEHPQMRPAPRLR